MHAAVARRHSGSAGPPPRWFHALLDPRDPAHRFALGVIVGACALVAAMAASGDFSVFGHLPLAYFAFAALVICGELFVLKLPSRADDVLLSASSVFAYAIAMLYGPAPAVVALCVASLIKGV